MSTESAASMPSVDRHLLPELLPHRSLYAAFDRFPSSKGAATHIHRMAGTLFRQMKGGLLYVVGDEELPAYQRERLSGSEAGEEGPAGSTDGAEAHPAVDVEILRHVQSGNFLERALGYGHHLRAVLETLGPSLLLCHFRDPWGGVPILSHPGRRYRTIYEINGLPSIELPSRYPALSRRTLQKIREMERLCWTAADLLVTPSPSMRDNLAALGVPAAKITVIPNGADLPPLVPPRPAQVPGRYLLYFGALQSWQGIDVLLRAFARLSDLTDLHLVICAAAPERQARGLRRLAERLGVAGRVIWQFRLSQAELFPFRSHAILSVAPLTECPRNLLQGCCPLKILESMAVGVPVVASDLPAVRDLITDGVEGRLVRPDRPAELARTLRVLLSYPELLPAMGQRARERITRDFTWAGATAQLAALYRLIAPTTALASTKTQEPSS